MTWLDVDALRRDGFVHVPSLVPGALVDDALAAIREDLRTSYDVTRQVEYDHRSYCPDLRASPPIMALVGCEPVRALVGQGLDWSQIHTDPGQIAIRRAHNAAAAMEPEPHIDGVTTAYNGVVSDGLKSFTALVGVFLTSQPRTYAGNFTVWPGSHHLVEAHFRRRGEQALYEGVPEVPLGASAQLVCGRGDVVFAHYQLVHSVTVNTSDVDRIAVFFRLRRHDLEARRWELLTHLWRGWRAALERYTPPH